MDCTKEEDILIVNLAMGYLSEQEPLDSYKTHGAGK